MIPHPLCFVFRAITRIDFMTAFGFDSVWVCTSRIISARACDGLDFASMIHISDLHGDLVLSVAHI